MKDKIKELISQNTKLDIKDIKLEIPPQSEMGDYALACFDLAKKEKKSPVDIAKELKEKIIENFNQNKEKLPKFLEKIETYGPYLNFFVNKLKIAESIIKEIQKNQQNYGKLNDSEIILVESPGPNTNKPLHLGHLRNILLGQSISNILRFIGKDVHIVNVVNDRGVHICKSMLAYQKFGNSTSPEEVGKKSDHFVGDYYVRYNQEAKKQSAENPDKGEKLEEEIHDLLIKWENSDPQVIKLWKKMNNWALKGFKETYRKLNFKIEKEYLESDTYQGGKDLILAGLEEGIFQKNKDGSIIIDLEDKKLDKKVLLRPDGTSVYITQDINMAHLRYEDFKFDKMIYVVGNEQQYHFKVLFEVFKALNFNFANKCYHFSYGMIELPEGKMKSREGNVIDTDNLIEEATELAKLETKKRYDNLNADEINDRANKIAMAAIKFSILKHDPLKNFIFDLKKSLEFEGDTGPYVLYSYVRIKSILKKYDQKLDKKINFSLLNTELDQKIIKLLKNYKGIIKSAAKNYKPSLIVSYLLELSSSFSKYYAQNPILNSDNEEIKKARLLLIDSISLVLKSGLNLLGIETVEQM
ncbi:arginine--tRNA ligase [bacterium]|nr:arginine--tRNA ligase [bacterium]